MVERVGSTNTALLRDIGAVEGDWLVALAQEEGRGRQGRVWEAPSGNFSGSTLIQLRPGDPPPATLSLACGLALIEALATLVPDAQLQLKWPNDLLLGHAKLAGILLEREGDRVVAGFGINLAQAPAILGRATAALFPVATVAPQAVAPLLAAGVARMLGLWRSARPEDFARAWLARAHPLGTPLIVHDRPGHQIEGRFEGLEPDGALRLRVEHGGIEIVRAGDVELE
ncbi:MAG: biotin--[acetyl-CoA-carboxylase] ligase [Sphingomicrobium sp.]